MATPPRPQTPPPRPNPPSPPPKPAAAHESEHEHERKRKTTREGEEGPDPDADPHPDLITTQEEQLDRSAEIEAMGVEAWKEAHDERNQADQQKAQHGRAVPGVSPTQKDDPGGKK